MESQAQLERARRLEAVGQLAGGVAHDFNNLLSVILNYAEYMIAVSEDPEILKGLREIEKAAGSAADLTRQLLLFSRRDALERGPVDLAAAIQDTKAMLRRTIGEHIQLVVDAPPGLQTVGLGVGQAQQVLVNLAVNARDALPEGGTIEVKVRELDAVESSAVPGLAAGPHLSLVVADNGIGMSKEVAGHAFDPFFTTKPRGQGTGLGLATVYGIVNQAGGQVAIKSEPQRGTTVSVYVPVDSRARPRPTLEPAPPASADERTVLVVENEQAVQTIVCSMLERHGYKTRTADSGAEAVGVIEAGEVNVDLLLTDVLMPGMSGRELVKRLRARNPNLRAIYMSGYAGDATSPLGGPWDDGVTVLQKPFTEAQLLHAVGDQLIAD
jgi:CheY-like chemotaxis protein/two-component sensor histidine kinase